MPDRPKKVDFRKWARPVQDIGDLGASTAAAAVDMMEMSMSMFGPKEGSWWLESKTDPRWNCSGRGFLLFSAGLPPEAKQKIEELKKLYGEPPEDLEWGGMKD